MLVSLKKQKLIKKQRITLMLLSCYMEPVSIYEFFSKINSLRIESFKLNIERVYIERFLNNGMIAKIHNKYIIDDLLIREKYFIDLFTTENKLFNEFTQLILEENSYYDYGSNSHKTFTVDRIELYKHKYIAGVYYYKDFYTNYIDKILEGFLNKEIDFSSNKETLVKIFIDTIWYKIFYFKNIDEDLELLKSLPEYWKLLINKKYSFILMYNYFMQGDIDKLKSLNIELYNKNSIERNVYTGMIELIKGNYDKSIFIFREELKKIRRDSNETNPYLYGELHSLAFILSVIKYPKFYTPIHNSYYKNIKNNEINTWLNHLYKKEIKNENINDDSNKIFIANNYLGVKTVSEIISYSWLNVIENWNTQEIEYIADLALANGYNWVALELSNILKHSINNTSKWSEIYKLLKEKMPNTAPISSMLKFNNQKNLIINLIEKDINSKTTHNISKPKERIIWTLDENYKGKLVLYSHYQKILKNGKYSALKNVSEEQLIEKYQSLLSVEDLIASKHNYYSFEDSFDLAEIGDVLTKMNNIFNYYDTDNNIVFKHEKFPITIYDTEENYQIDIEELEIKKNSLLKKNDYLYNVIHLNDNTQKLLKEIKKAKPIFPISEKNILLNWIKNNDTLDIKTTFYHPKSINPKLINLDMKVIYDIDFDGDYFNVEIKISPSPNWDLYNIHKKGITIIHKDNNNNYFMIKRDKKAELKLIQKINNKLKVKTKKDDCKFKTKSSKRVIKILEKSEKIDELEIRWSKKGKKKTLKTISTNNVNWKIKSKNNWFELEGTIEFDDNEKILLNELLSKNNKQSFFTLKNGDIVNITNELRSNFEKLEKTSINKDNKMIIPPYFAKEMNEILEIGKILEHSEEWEKSINKFKKLDKKDIKIPAKMEIILRDYQKTGVKWISKMTNSGFGVCLADDMGLGKTIQAIMAIAIAPEKSIVIAPASVLYNWQAEFKRFAPQLNTIIYEGKTDKSIFKKLKKTSMIIISYDKFQRDSELFNKENWGFVVLDEAQMIKNAVTKRAKAIFELKADKRIALSGTPIENHLGELWSLYHFLNPILLGSKQMFNEFFVKPILNKDEETKNMLIKMLDPFLLRRLKKDVLKELPDKTEIIRLVNFEGKEKSYYEVLRRKALKEMGGNTDKAGVQRIKILAHLTKLRQASCDISLIGQKIEESAKTIATIDLIKDITNNNHKVLVFSQFTSYLSIIKAKLDKENIKYLYLDGNTAKKKRQELVNEFQTGTEKVFLISLKAGGTGLNLTVANYVIHLDPWWNPAVEDQATDRTHRIGQSKNVTVYKMIVKNSIEEKIIKLHESKKDLSNSILDNMDKVNTKLSIDDLMALL